jgi:hypothetical protein
VIIPHFEAAKINWLWLILMYLERLRKSTKYSIRISGLGIGVRTRDILNLEEGDRDVRFYNLRFTFLERRRF